MKMVEYFAGVLVWDLTDAECSNFSVHHPLDVLNLA
jgi:hypothetical protein